MNKLIKVIYICIFSTIFFSHTVSNAVKRSTASAKKKQQKNNKNSTAQDEIISLKNKISKYQQDCECVKEYDKLKEKLELLQNGSTSKKRKAAAQKTEQRENDDYTTTLTNDDDSSAFINDDDSWQYVNNISPVITKMQFMYDEIEKYKSYSIIADNTNQTQHLQHTEINTTQPPECNTITNTMNNKIGKKYKIDKKERIKFIQDLEKYRKIYA